MNKIYSVRSELEKENREKLRSFGDLGAHLLYHRGIKDEAEAEAFVNPKYDKGLHDPFLLNDMDKAVKRILKAIKGDERIVIFSDYDADGIPGAVVLHDFFKKIGFENFTNYIPNRNTEGFGLNKSAIEGFGKDGVGIMITIDCGITNIEEVAFANSLGIETIITDHHLPKENLPNAFAIINPKVSEEYPEKMLCGSGVVFKLVEALISKGRSIFKIPFPKGHEKWFLDMVGVATLSDMVPLTGENRTFGYFGLKVLQKSRRIGLVKLLRKIKVNQRNLTEDDVGFMISPRINAASRMGESMDAFKLLVSEDENEASDLVDHLEKINNERKGVVAHISKEVKKMIEAKYAPAFQNKIIVIGNPLWKPSLLGLVAGSIAEAHQKPVFLWGREGMQEALKGSCRSYGDTNLALLMSGVREGVFNEFGGHALAGGFSVSNDEIHALEDELSKSFLKNETNKEKIAVLVDREVSLEDLDNRFLQEIEKLAPYGTGNLKPLFIIPKIEIYDIQFFGKEKNHLKLVFQKRNGRSLEAICFFVEDSMLKKTEKGKVVSLVGHVERAFFGGNPVRIRIVDIV